MEKAIELAIIILSLYYVGMPLFRRQVYGIGASQGADRDGYHRLLVLKENAYATIKDIQFDYKTGKISDEDYKELMAKYEAEAVDILKKIDDFKENRKKRSNKK